MGNFDGVHLGHRALLDKSIAIGKKENLPSLAITYHPHPGIVLGKKSHFLYIQTLESRKETLLRTGISDIDVLPFTRDLSEMEAEDFLENILINQYKARHIVIGFNHCFGKNRRGNFQLLEELSNKYGYRVYQVDPVYVGEEKISSSLIRNSLAEGNIPKANACLGRRFSLSGRVRHGKKLGRELGSPTANLSIPENVVLPMNGVYATFTQGKPSVTNLGTKPTFGDNSITIETHILDWKGDIYDEVVGIEFVAKLRNISKFIGADDLADQIQMDIQQARKILEAPPDY